jgi:hypothetical protein
MANTPRRISPTLERKIHFYRADAGVDDNGRPRAFDPAPALAVISTLPFAEGPSSRYLVDDDGNALGVWPAVTAARKALRFCQVRRVGLPMLERGGNVSDLNIADDEGLLEPVHVVFFADNIVGADFNFYGPRLSRLGYYLRTKAGDQVPVVQFLPTLRRDVARQLDSLEELRLFDLKIKASYADAVRQADASLGDAFAANARVLEGHSDEIELILKPSKDGRWGALRRLLPALKSLVGRGDFHENSAKFQVKGRNLITQQIDTIDLLKDQLIETKQILRLGARSRAVDPQSAYGAVEAAYQELGDELRLAAGVAE